MDTISSQGLAERFHLNAAQIRKDLACFGEFGVRGVGYYVKDLGAICGRSSASIGASASRSWAQEISGSRSPTIPDSVRRASRSSPLFDTLNDKVGQLSRSGVAIHDIRQLKRIVRHERLSIAVIAVPAPPPSRWSISSSPPASRRS